MSFVVVLIQFVIYLMYILLTSYATYVTFISSILLLYIGEQRYYVKRNKLYDAHSIKLSKLRIFGRRVVKTSIIREHDAPRIIVGLSVGLLAGVTVRMQYPRFWMMSRMYPEVEAFWYGAFIIMLSFICGCFAASFYSHAAEKRKGELKEKII